MFQELSDVPAPPSMATIERLRRSSRESIAFVKQVVDEGLDEAKKKWEAAVSGRDSSRDSGTSAEAEEQKHELSDSGVAFPAVHPARSLPLPEAWPNRPLLLRRSAVAHGSASGDGCSDSASGDGCSEPQPRPHSYPQPQLGVSFPVETELFEGHAQVEVGRQKALGGGDAAQSRAVPAAFERRIVCGREALRDATGQRQDVGCCKGLAERHQLAAAEFERCAD